jgi:MerR family transcriptional regulator, light-induced transcriptional regulator
MNKALSGQIKKLRREKGYTQGDLAKLLGTAQTTIANYESGTRLPDAERLQKLADTFEVTVDYLLGRAEISPALHIKKEDEFVDLKFEDEVYMLYIDYLLKGDKKGAAELVNRLYKGGMKTKDIYSVVLEKALRKVGELWEKGKVDIWEEHLISEATADIMREVKTWEKKADYTHHSIMALTSGPELHNIGLKMITDMLELEGWRVIYLGSNVPVRSLIRAIESKKPDVLAISITLEHHIDSAKNLIGAIREHIGINSPRIIVGGAAFHRDEEGWRETGADFYGSSVEDVYMAVSR